MRGIFLYMGAGVALTGLIAYMLGSWAVSSEAAATTYVGLMSGPTRWVIMLSPFAIILAMNFGLERLSVSALQAMLLGVLCAVRHFHVVHRLSA